MRFADAAAPLSTTAPKRRRLLRHGPPGVRSGVAAGFGTMNEHFTNIGNRHGWGDEIPFGISATDKRHHLYLIGKTGSGKTTLLRNLIVQHIAAGHGVDFTIGFNPLATVPGITFPLALPEFPEHIYPKYVAPIVIQTGRTRIFTTKAWGISVAVKGVKGQRILKPVTNARNDKLTGFTWRHAVRERRCLIPATGYFEPGRRRKLFSVKAAEVRRKARWMDSC